MSSQLQIIRRFTPFTVLFDLNDPTGANSADYGGVQTDLLANPDFGPVAHQPVRYEPPGITGGVTTFNRAGLASMMIPLRIRAASYDNLATAVGRLSDLLAEGGTMRWIADGSANTRYIDFEPSTAPALIDGRELAATLAIQRFDTPEGVSLQITRQPYFRGAQLFPDDNVLTNATLLRDDDNNGTPNDYAWLSTVNITNQLIDAASEAYMFDIATGATREFTQTTPSSTVTPTDVWTMSAYAHASIGTNAAAQAIVEYQTNAGAVVGSIQAGTLTALTGTWQRLTVTSTVPATAGKARVGIRMDNTDAVPATVHFRNLQFEEAATARDFRVRSANVDMLPTATGMVRVLPIYNPADAPSPCVFEITPTDADSTVTDVYMALRGSRRVQGDRMLADYLNGPFYAPADATALGWTIALGTGVTDTGTTARIDHATNPTLYSKKITWTRTTDLDSLRGETDVWINCTPVGGAIFYLQLRWGPAGGSPVPYTLPEVRFDAELASVHGRVMVNVGRLKIPTEPTVTLGTLTMELWTHTNAFDQDLDVHAMYLMPAEEQAHVTVPASGAKTWLGRELVSPVTNPGGGTAAVISGDNLEFDTTTDNAGTPPASGSITEAGRHKVTFVLLGSGFGGQFSIIIRNITDSVNTYSRTVSLTGSHTTTEGILFDAVAGKTYQAQVDNPITVGCEVLSITDEYVPVIAQNERIRTDPGSTPGRYAVEKLNSSGVLVSNLGASDVPFVVPPGLSLVYFEVLDASIANYDVPFANNARSISVSPMIYPRYPG